MMETHSDKAKPYYYMGKQCPSLTFKIKYLKGSDFLTLKKLPFTLIHSLSFIHSISLENTDCFKMAFITEQAR
jgi:hypothetical protein